MESTLNVGLTYPDPEDHTRLWEYFSSLANGVDVLAGPPLHTDITIANSKLTASEWFGWYWWMGMIKMSGMLQWASGDAPAAASVVAQLPDDAMPRTSGSWAVPIGGGKVGYVQVSTAGDVKIQYSSSLYTPGTWMAFDGVIFPAKYPRPKSG